jgi:hypothetical protein
MIFGRQKYLFLARDNLFSKGALRKDLGKYEASLCKNGKLTSVMDIIIGSRSLNPIQIELV